MIQELAQNMQRHSKSKNSKLEQVAHTEIVWTLCDVCTSAPMNLLHDTMKTTLFYATTAEENKDKQISKMKAPFTVEYVIVEGRTSSPLWDIHLNTLQPQVPMTDLAL